MRQAFIVSKAQELKSGGHDPALTLNECFFLATMGGAQVCCLEDRIGSFAVGKDFDALEIHTTGINAGIITPIEDVDDIEMMFEKFIMSGDDRNIVKVYVKGRSIKM